MSSSRHHIPFPTNFLSLNTPLKKAAPTTNNAVTASPESEAASHSFLSNHSHPVPRHSSVSSVNSVGSTSSEASARPISEPSSPSVLKPALPTFLALNTKYVAPPATAKEMSGDKGGFLSNRA